MIHIRHTDPDIYKRTAFAIKDHILLFDLYCNELLTNRSKTKKYVT